MAQIYGVQYCGREYLSECDGSAVTIGQPAAAKYDRTKYGRFKNTPILSGTNIKPTKHAY